MSEYRFLDASLTVDERVSALLNELTLDEKLLLITTHQGAVPRLGIKEMHIGAEVARGLVCRDGKGGEWQSTVFPEPFGLAATFDTALMRSIGEVTGTEARIYAKQGKSSLCVWGPTVDMERDPRWGRTEEAYGEDPFLAGEMAAAYTKGMAGVNEKYYRVIPTLKHFYANNNEEDRSSDNAMIPTRLKHDYYLKAFEKPVKEGRALSLMTSYNEINGVEANSNPELSNICKKDWGLLFSVTDGGDFIQNVQAHKRDKTHAEAFAKIYKNHGADVMTDNEDIVRTTAKLALERGLVSENDIDQAIYGVLKARFLLGEFDSECLYNDYREDLICCDEYQKISEKAAEKSVVLLKNNKAVLPLSKTEKLAVIGYYADMTFRDWYTGLSPKTPTILDGIIAAAGRENVVYEAGNDVIALRNAENGFYFSLNDDGELVCESPTINENCLFELFDWGDGAVSFKSKVSGKYVADAGVMKCCSDNVYGWFVKERFMMERDGRDCILRNWQNRFLTVSADRKIRVSNSLRPTKKSVFNIELFSSGLDRVRRVATEAHNVLVICGNNPMINARECHDRKHLDLPQKQLTVMDNVASINANTVLCLVSGYPFAVNDERISAIMHITHAGPAIGTAVAKTIFGDVSPAGRCPITWYRSEKELCDIKDYNIIRTGSTYLYYEGEPLFPFGHGLSYTSFRYGSIKTDKRAYVKGETVKVTFDITNMGGCSSDEVAQLYIAPPKLPVTLPEKQLRAFKRVFVPKGEVITVTLSFKVDDLAFWNDNIGDFDVFAGTYELLVGGSSTDIRRTAEIHISGSEYTGTDVSRIVHAVESTEYLGVTYDADEKLEEYALINDWQSFISYEYCEMKGYHRVDLVVSNPGSSASLSFICEETDEVIAVCEIPPTGSLTEFIKVSAPAEPVQGLHKLKLVSSGMISLKSFSFS